MRGFCPLQFACAPLPPSHRAITNNRPTTEKVKEDCNFWNDEDERDEEELRGSTALQTTRKLSWPLRESQASSPHFYLGSALPTATLGSCFLPFFSLWFLPYLSLQLPESIQSAYFTPNPIERALFFAYSTIEPSCVHTVCLLRAFCYPSRTCCRPCYFWNVSYWLVRTRGPLWLRGRSDQSWASYSRLPYFAFCSCFICTWLGEYNATFNGKIQQPRVGRQPLDLQLLAGLPLCCVSKVPGPSTSTARGGIDVDGASGVVVCLNHRELVARLILRLQRILQRAREGQVPRRLSEAPRAAADRGGPARLPRLDHAGRGPRGQRRRCQRVLGGLRGQEAVDGGGGGQQRGRSSQRGHSGQRDWLRQWFRCCSTHRFSGRRPRISARLACSSPRTSIGC